MPEVTLYTEFNTKKNPRQISAFFFSFFQMGNTDRRFEQANSITYNTFFSQVCALCLFS